MPGLLQTAEYARAMLATRPNTSDDEVDDLVAARLARQAVLDRDDPPLLWAVIDEAVLHRPVGDAKVMRDQLTHLVEMSARPGRAQRPHRGARRPDLAAHPPGAGTAVEITLPLGDPSRPGRAAGVAGEAGR